MALAPVLIIALLVDGYMAYWIVSKYVRFSNPPKYEVFIKIVIGMVLFLVFAFLTFLVVIDNVRLEQ
ncbi:MAG: hypothetical protein K2P88_00025 [Chitinophagaceae bacterium]|uniref:hypothetical protein n=1 Tax=unclassified Paraflavitalea TaxID=2798305 RepID=UPI003D327049|nr:hypothetical protein [Chitinophagaceae bacterium]